MTQAKGTTVRDLAAVAGPAGRHPPVHVHPERDRHLHEAGQVSTWTYTHFQVGIFVLSNPHSPYSGFIKVCRHRPSLYMFLYYSLWLPYWPN